MQEAFIHFLWQYQYFDKKNLCTIDGQQLTIFSPGYLQSDAGPDFSYAKIKLNDIEWSGNIEIHTKASDWYHHDHHQDNAYDNVILHVVWQYDKEVVLNDNSPLPVLELHNRVDNSLIEKYRKLVNQISLIPCSTQWHKISKLTKLSMWDKVLTERLERKSDKLITTASELGGDWEEVAYRLLMTNFGFKLNAEVFGQLAKSMPHKLLLKHANNLTQVEALLYGQAGFLEASNDEYQLNLQKEYNFLSKKYNIYDLRLHSSQWKYLRMRPANFPTVRLAQVSTILTQFKNIFATLLSVESYSELLEKLRTPLPAYWQEHYHFGKKSNRKMTSMGKMSVESIFINTIVPLLVAYGRSRDQLQYMDRAISFLNQIPSENNRIIRQWKQLGETFGSSFYSQAAIELHNEYCMRKKCLNCNNGVNLLTGS